MAAVAVWAECWEASDLFVRVCVRACVCLCAFVCEHVCSCAHACSTRVCVCAFMTVLSPRLRHRPHLKGD